MTKQIQVKKRDGTTENFEQAKIARVVTAAGLTEEQGEQLAIKVTSWVSNRSDSVISSNEIRDKVLKELERVNYYAANLYGWYEKTKDKGEETA